MKLTLSTCLLLVLSILLSVACTATNEIEPIHLGQSGSEFEIVEDKSSSDITASKAIDQAAKVETVIAVPLEEQPAIDETLHSANALPLSQESDFPIEKPVLSNQDVPIATANIEQVPDYSKVLEGILEEPVASTIPSNISQDVTPDVIEPAFAPSCER